MTETQSGKFMSFDVAERLGDDNTVGVVNSFDPTETTVTYTDVGPKFRLKADDDLVGDDDSTIFVASENGDLSLGYGPQFDKTIVTNVKRNQLKRVLRRLREAGDSYSTGNFDIHFDHAGPVVFDGDVLVVTCPVRFPWDFGSPERAPSGPSGPSIRGCDL